MCTASTAPIPAYHITCPQLHINCIRRFLRIAIDVKDRVDFEVGSLLWNSVRRLFGVAVHIEDGIDFEISPLLWNSIGGLFGVAVHIEDGIDFEISPLLWNSIGGLFGVAVHIENCVNLEIGSLRIGWYDMRILAGSMLWGQLPFGRATGAAVATANSTERTLRLFILAF
jgi:hypothetical protein